MSSPSLSSSILGTDWVLGLQEPLSDEKEDDIYSAHLVSFSVYFKLDYTVLSQESKESKVCECPRNREKKVKK